MNRNRSFLAYMTKVEGLPIVFVFLTLMVAFLIVAPDVFSGWLIYRSFLQTTPPQVILALGLTMVISAGEIDLSFSAVIAFSGFIFSFIFLHLGMPWLAFAAALAGGALVGWVNGILVAVVGVPSIMATLAAQFFWNGLTVLLCGGKSWYLTGIKDYTFHSIFVGRIFGEVPAQALWALGLTVMVWFIVNRHRFGQAVLFIGDSTEVARVMGINVKATTIKLFTLNGLLAGFAGVLLTLEMTNFFTTQGAGLLLPVMAAVFIGGTSIAGGEAMVVGTFFGAYIMGSLEAGVVASGIGGYWTRLVSGVVMGASVALNAVIESHRGGGFRAAFKRWTRSSKEKEA